MGPPPGTPATTIFEDDDLVSELPATAAAITRVQAKTRVKSFIVSSGYHFWGIAFRDSRDMLIRHLSLLF